MTILNAATATASRHEVTDSKPAPRNLWPRPPMSSLRTRGPIPRCPLVWVAVVDTLRKIDAGGYGSLRAQGRRRISRVRRYGFAISPRVAREACFEFLPSETSEGVGGRRAPDAPQPRVRSGSKQMHTSIHSGSTRNHPASPHAMVLRLIRDLPGEPCTVATVALGFKVLSGPVEPNEPPQALTPASGASGPHDFAVHAQRRHPACRYRSRRLIRPATHRNAGRCRVHRIPFPTFVTIAKRPSEWERMQSPYTCFAPLSS